MKLDQNQLHQSQDELSNEPLFLRLYDIGIRCIRENSVTVIVVSVALILCLFVGSILAGALVNPVFYSLLIIPLLLSTIPLMAFLIRLQIKKTDQILTGPSPLPSPRAPSPFRVPGPRQSPPPSPQPPRRSQIPDRRPSPPQSPPDAPLIEEYDPSALIDVSRPIPGFQAFDPSALEDIVSPFGPEGGVIFLDDSGIPFIIPPDKDVPPSPIPGVVDSIIPTVPPDRTSSPTRSPSNPDLNLAMDPDEVVSPVIPVSFRLEQGQLPETTLELLNQIRYVLGEHCWKLTLYNPVRGIYGERTHATTATMAQIFVFNPRFNANYINERDISLLEGMILSHHIDNAYPQNPRYKLPPTDGKKTAFVFTKDLNTPLRTPENPRAPDSLEQKIHSLVHVRMGLPYEDPRPTKMDIWTHTIPTDILAHPGFTHLTQLIMPCLDGQSLCEIYTHFYSKYCRIFKEILSPLLENGNLKHLVINIKTLESLDLLPGVENEVGISAENLDILEERLIYAACLQALTDSGLLEGAVACGQELTIYLLLDISAGNAI